MSYLLILQTGNMIAGNVKDESRRTAVNEVRVSAVPETQALTSSWVEAFSLDNPEARINMVTGDQSESADISIITDRTTGFDSKRDYWKIVVGRDVLVPVMDASDPYLESILERGISPAEYAAILTSDGKYSWGNMPGTGNSTIVSAIIPEDDAALNAISAFAGIDPAMVRAVRFSAGDEIAAMDRKPGTIVSAGLQIFQPVQEQISSMELLSYPLISTGTEGLTTLSSSMNPMRVSQGESTSVNSRNHSAPIFTRWHPRYRQPEHPPNLSHIFLLTDSV